MFKLVYNLFKRKGIYRTQYQIEEMERVIEANIERVRKNKVFLAKLKRLRIKQYKLLTPEERLNFGLNEGYIGHQN